MFQSIIDTVRNLARTLINKISEIIRKTINYDGQYATFLFLTGAIISGITLVELEQREYLLAHAKDFSIDSDRINRVIHFGIVGKAGFSGGNWLAEIPQAPKFFILANMVLETFSSGMLMFVCTLTTAACGALAGSIFRNEPHGPRADLIGLGAGLVVWLAGNAGVQVVSFGINGSGSESYRAALIAFIAGFAAEKVFVSISNLSPQGATTRTQGNGTATTPKDSPRTKRTGP